MFRAYKNFDMEKKPTSDTDKKTLIWKKIKLTVFLQPSEGKLVQRVVSGKVYIETSVSMVLSCFRGDWK